MKDPAKRQIEKQIKKPKALFMIYLIIALTFSISLIVPAAQAQTKVCCEKTKSDEYCLYTDKYNCQPSSRMAESTCDQTAYCQVGCCYSDDTGYCYPNTPKSKCDALQGTWTADSTCSISQCKKGCCTISDQCSFITQTMCKRETSKFQYVSMDYDESVATEAECTDKCKSQELGACVSSDKTCTFTTRESCTETKQEGTSVGFNTNKLCSAPELGTNCAKQQNTKCYQGKVYWFDSCGNRENIYMSDKTKSYNNGYILDESRTCEASPNDPECGNCNYANGNICGSATDVKPAYGDYICRDLNCHETTESSASPDATGLEKQHGESWCLYETAVGFGLDVVGSRHVKASCINGEELIEPCKDYREEYCIQTVSGSEPTTNLGSLFALGEGYSEAICKENRFADCASCNDLPNDEPAKERTDCCEDIRTKDCFMFGDTCAPIIKPGLKFWDESSSSTCEKGTSVCKVKWEKKQIGLFEKNPWKCVKNCQCLTPEWIAASNKKCTLQGDCGAYYNIEGVFTSEGTTILSTSSYHFKFKNITQDMVDSWNEIENPDATRGKLTKSLWPALVVGGIGTAFALSQIFNIPFLYTAATTIGMPISLSATVTTTIPTPVPASGIFATLSKAATFSAGETAAMAALYGILFWAGAAILLAEIIDATAGPRVKKETITIKCNPWEQPDKIDDCEKCNEGKVPCSEYRCRSLGRYCEIINEGTENEKCIYNNPYDTNAPIIASKQKDYEFTESDLGYTITQEIPPFTPVTLAVETNEPAICKFSLDQNIPYKQMEVPFGPTFYDYNHTVTFSLPSELQSEEALKLTNGGKYALHLKCIDKAGNDNKKDYYIKFQISKGPDFTPPKIEVTSISNNAYIANDKSKVQLFIYLNEPSTCRWSNTDQDYSAMANTFACTDDGFDISSVSYGLYECSTELPIEKAKTNNYFFRCMDRNNNVNVQSYPYTLLSTIPLKISSIEPSGVVYTANPVLRVKTADGASNGVAYCGFSSKNDPLVKMIQFLETNSTEHKQQLSALKSGIYTYYVQCIDKAGNLAKTSTTMEIQADLTSPELSRVYKDMQQNVLVIELSEKTTCEYSFEAFNYGTGIAMTGLKEYIHKTNLDLQNNVYFIICQDEYQNQMDFKVIT